MNVGPRLANLERLYITDFEVGDGVEGTPHLFVEECFFMTLIVQLLNFPIFRLKESGAINGSLFALGQVVDALNQGLVRS